jgi:hypothetical protein
MPFDGTYPAVPGNKKESILDRAINGAYTAVGVATNPTGGILISATEFGLSYIEYAQVIGSDNGQYNGVVYASPFIRNGPSPAIRLQVIVAATGAEASGTIAAGRVMRILAKGY